MKAVIQRVSEASVTVDNEIVGEIGPGLVILLGVSVDDNEADADYLAEKITNLRIFNDNDGKMNLSLLDVKGEMLAISQFTLYGNTRKGRRPSFVNAARPEASAPLYEYFMKQVEAQSVNVARGIFGAMMHVKIFNDGPVTIVMESKERFQSRKG